jgi:EmrB/QacA subfamily drug resistance transporter
VNPTDYSRRWLMLPVILSATFMAIFDFFVVNVAAPSLQLDLHAGDAALELIVGGYAFTYASGMVTGGRLGDIFGYRRLFMIGMASFAVASLLCGLAQTPGQLIVARLFQGLTGAVMVPQVLALITAAFPATERARAMSWFGAVVGLASVAGQVLGGLLLSANVFGLGWRAIFLVNVPIAAAALGISVKLVPHAKGARRPRLDPVGALGLSSGLGLALVPMILGRSEGWPVWTWAMLASAVPVLAVTLWWERRLTRRAGEPLLDLALFGNRSFSAGLAVNFAFMAFFGSFMFALTLALQSGLGMTPLRAGLTFGPLAIVFATVSMFGSRLFGRFGIRIVTAGAGVSVVGLTLMAITLSVLGGRISAPWLLPGMMLVGLGNGLLMPSIMGAVLSGVNRARAGAAAGVLTTVQQFASAAGVAVLGAVFFATIGGHPSRSEFARALEFVVVFDLALAAVAMALTLLLPRTPAAAPIDKPADADEALAEFERDLTAAA